LPNFFALLRQELFLLPALQKDFRSAYKLNSPFTGRFCVFL